MYINNFVLSNQINGSLDEIKTNVSNSIMSLYVVLFKVIGGYCQNTDNYGE